MVASSTTSPGLPGPWVSRQKFKLIERFKFFLDLAWKRGSWRARGCSGSRGIAASRNDFRWPLEMRVIQWLRAAQKLS